MKRKVLSLLLALSCTVSLAACGTKKVAEKAPAAKEGVATEMKPESGAKLVVWTNKGVETDYLKLIGTEFEKK